MTWDGGWEKIFREHEWGKYPPEELIRFVARNYYRAPQRKSVRILELGCGPGANVWYLAREGFDAWGIDGSPTAIERAGKRLAQEGLSAHLKVGDIALARDHCPQGQFDAVIDVCCLQCNRLADVAAILKSTHGLLKPAGKFFGMLLAEGSWGDGAGTEVEPRSFQDIREGPLQGMGLNHFFTMADVESVMKPFADLAVERSERTMDNRRRTYAHWVVEGRRVP